MDKTLLHTEILSSLLDDDYIRVPIKLAKLIGLNEAIVLRKIHEWVKFNSRKDNRDYFYNEHYWTHQSYKEFVDDFPWWSVKTIQRTIKDLEDIDVILSAQPRRIIGDCTKWYRVDVQKLIELYIKAASNNLTSPPVDNLTSPPVDNLTSPPVDNLTSPPVDNLTSPIYKDSISKKEIAKKEIAKKEEDSPTPHPTVVVVESVPEIPQPQTSNKLALPRQTSADRVRQTWQETGFIPKIPLELDAWAFVDIGEEVIKTYRHSGRISTTKKGDIKQEFALYISSQWIGKDIDYGYDRIRKLESDPKGWEVLVSLVAKWQLSKQLGQQINITTEISRQSELERILNAIE